MAAKTTTPDQHLMLHKYWPNDCCLCGHESTILRLELEVAKLKMDIEVWQRSHCELTAENVELRKAQNS